MAVGTFDTALFERYRAAPPGPEKRRLHGLLVAQNAPLARTIVAQLTGRGGGSGGGRKASASKMGGRGDFDRVEPEEAEQLGLIALAKAIEMLDPQKGRLSYQVALWARHELQRYCVFSLDLGRAPAGKAALRPRVGLVGMPAEDEERVTAEERAYFGSDTTLGEILESEDAPKGERLAETDVPDWADVLDVDDLKRDPAFLEAAAEFQETGVWPEAFASMSAFRAATARPEPAAAPSVVYSIPRPSLEVFLSAHCIMATHARVPRGAFGDEYEKYCAGAGIEAMTRESLYLKLEEKGIQETRVRVGSPVRGLAGIRVVGLTTKIHPDTRVSRSAARMLTDYQSYAEIQRGWLSGRRPVPTDTEPVLVAAMLAT